MSKKVCIMTTCLALSLASSFSFAKEPENANNCKKAIINYYESGEYAKDVTKVINEAKDYLQTRISENAKAPKKQKLAMILDIDETTLTSYDCFKNIGFTSSFEQMNTCFNTEEKHAIPQTLDLYKFAKANDVAVFFITGKKQVMKKKTENLLKREGYENWDGYYFLPDDYSFDQKVKNIPKFKTDTRKKIIAEGYDIVLNMGDQKSDLVNSYADKDFKLPNPMFFTP